MERLQSAGKSAVKMSDADSRGKKVRRKRQKEPGKKDKYHRFVEPKLKLILSWKRMGWTDEEVAKKLDIAYSTFKIYKGKYDGLSAVLRAGADEANAEVENALFEKACGIKTIVKKPIKVREAVFENGRKVKEIERIEYAEEEVFVPPDVTADMFYLKNRVPHRWGERKEILDDERATGIILLPEAKE